MFTLPCPCRCGHCGDELIREIDTNLCSCGRKEHGGYYGCPGLEHVSRRRLPLDVVGTLRNDVAGICAAHETVIFRKRGDHVEVECE